jgi:SAM-dependent methyltransferase
MGTSPEDVGLPRTGKTSLFSEKLLMKLPPISNRACRSAWVVLGLLAAFLNGCASTHASAPESDQIAAAMGLRPGMQVADVGAGDGEFTVELARIVGTSGQVYATEVDADDVDELQTRFDEKSLSNVTTILGDQQGSGLPEGCCDAILLRLVYHHFQNPAAMLSNLGEALRGDGVVVVIEITPQRNWGQLPGVPDRGGHGIATDDLIKEMAAEGWEIVERPDWDGEEEDHYCVVFLRSP